MKFKLAFSIFFSTLSLLTSAEIPVFDFSRKDDFRANPFGPSSEVKHMGKEIKLTLKAGPDRWQGVIFTPCNTKYFDITQGSVVALDVKNQNPFPMSLHMEIVNAHPDNPNSFSHISAGAIALLPYEKGTLRVRYGRAAKIVDWNPKGMQTNFDGFGNTANNRFNVIPEKISQFRIWSSAGEKSDLHCTISNIRLEDPPKPLSAALDSKEAFYPFIDQFGQYKHADWENKIKSVEDLRMQKEKEDADLAANPVPRGRTRFGGWADGPTFKDRIGRWSTVKYKGKWFFTDPDGKLFWSMGMNSIESRDACDPTGISYRENYFEKLPQAGEPGIECFSYRSFPRFGFYKGKGNNSDHNIQQFFFPRYNMLLKYGPDYDQEFMTRSQKRLKSWGFNTNGNWLEPDILKQDHLPYMTCITFKTFYQVIEGCKLIGWQKFPDVFNPEFAKGLEENLLSTHRDTINDEFCIGYFMDNELSWGKTDTFLAEGTLRSGAQQPAKQAMTEMFKKKYSDISALNKVWGTDYKNWENFCATTSVPSNMKNAENDLTEFNDYLVNSYFKICKEVINRVAPGKLYFGCRFNDWNVKVIKTAAKYMDACSFNRYSPEVGRFALPEGADLPVIIGEWHFGTVTNGPSHPGLQATANQKERARAYDRYVRSALWNPYIVGVHYFKYCDQATTGRPADDENIQCGFIDICDTPYTDIVNAARKVGQDMYEYRVNNGPKE